MAYKFYDALVNDEETPGRLKMYTNYLFQGVGKFEAVVECRSSNLDTDFSQV